MCNAATSPDPTQGSVITRPFDDCESDYNDTITCDKHHVSGCYEAPTQGPSDTPAYEAPTEGYQGSGFYTGPNNSYDPFSHKDLIRNRIVFE